MDPSDFRWPYFLAQLAKSQGDLPKATSLFDRVLQLKPDDTDTLVWLGEVHLTAGHAELAAPLFARVLALEPNSVSARFGAGRAALVQGDNQKAVAMLEEVLRLNPKATAAHYPLSQAYAALGDQARASEHLRLRRDGRIAPRDTLMVELNSLLQSPRATRARASASWTRKTLRPRRSCSARALRWRPMPRRSPSPARPHSV